MADYKQMYLEVMQATEDAIQRLIEAQQRCEEMYMDAVETPLTVISVSDKEKTNGQKPPV